MRIVILTYRGNPFCGGQGVYVTHLAREMVRMGHEVHCIHGPPYSPEEPGIVWHRVPGLNLFEANGNYPPRDNPLAAFTPLNLYERATSLAGQFPELNGFSWRAFLKLRQLMGRYRFDVIHDNQTLGWGLLAIRALGIPLVATIHHPLTIDRARGFDPPATFRQRFDKVRFLPVSMQGFVSRRISHIVTVSHASARDIAADFRVRPSRIRVIHNGLDSQRFQPQPHVKRVPGRLLFVGNLQDGNKGGIYLLRAMARLPPPAHLVVATGGVDLQWLDGHLEALGLRGRVIVKTKVPPQELVGLYATSELAISPSLYEGFGFPAAEAMACGLPLVAARGGALPEVVGDAGVLVPPADEGALAKAIGQLLNDPERRARLGRAARERIVTKFRWEDAAERMVAVYREALDAHR